MLGKPVSAVLQLAFAIASVLAKLEESSSVEIPLRR
jgi:hypothetical protein